MNQPNQKVKFELKRTGFHNLWGLLAIPVAVLLQKGILSPAILDFFIYGIMGVIASIVDVIRPLLFRANQKWGWLDNKYLHFLLSIEQYFVTKEVLREEERTSYSGVGSYLIGIIIVYGCYDFYIAAIAVMILAFGDPLARIIGKKYGERRSWLVSLRTIVVFYYNRIVRGKFDEKQTSKGKTIEGMVAFLMFSFIIIVLAVSWLDSLAIPFFPIGYTMGTKVWMIFVGCAVGAVTEVYAGNLDNLLIPIIVAEAMSLCV